MKNFYVYVYLDPRKTGEFIFDEFKFDFEPFYVGKGKNRRLYYHLTNKSLKRNDEKSKRIKDIIKDNNIFKNINKIILY